MSEATSNPELSQLIKLVTDLKGVVESQAEELKSLKDSKTPAATSNNTPATDSERLSEVEATLKRVLDENAQLKSENREEKTKALLKAGLEKRGVTDPVRSELALEHLYNRVKFDNKGNAKLKIDNESFDLEAGLDHFEQTDRINVFRPPTDTGGTGTKTPTKTNPGNNIKVGLQPDGTLDEASWDALVRKSAGI